MKNVVKSNKDYVIIVRDAIKKLSYEEIRDVLIKTLKGLVQMNKKIVILLLLLVTLSGCTKRFTVEDKENDTKESYVSNIVCKPESKELDKIYEDNKDKLEVDYDKLPECSDLKVNSGGYEGQASGRNRPVPLPGALSRLRGAGGPG